MDNIKQDEEAIDDLTYQFFDLFTNTKGKIPHVENIIDLFIKEGTIINITSGDSLIYDLQRFIEPRNKLLTDGTLRDFQEYEVSHKTEIFGRLAHRFSLYEKSGVLNGSTFKTQGTKSIQLIKINNYWKIFSVIWCDRYD